MIRIFRDKKSFLNPFFYIAGTNALLWGLLFMAISAWLGSINNHWQDGLIDLHHGPDGSFLMHLTTVVTNWLSLLLVLSPMAWWLSDSRIRLIDLAGTLAMARIPMIIAVTTGFSYAPLKMAQYLSFAYLGIGEPVNITPTDIAVAIFMMLLVLLSTIWMITLSYNAYRVSANIKGLKAGISFTTGFILAYVLSKIAATWLIRHIFV